MKLNYDIQDRPKFGQLLVFAFQQLLAILAAAAVYALLVLCLEVLRREEIMQLPKGEKIAKFLFKS